MKLFNQIKCASTDVKLSIIFAISMLLTSVIAPDHAYSDTLLILQIGVYFAVVGVIGNKKKSHKPNCCATSMNE